MLDIIHTTKPDGTFGSFYRLDPAKQARYPQYLVVHMPAALQILDAAARHEDFPTMNVDSILQIAIDAMSMPGGQRRADTAFTEILREILFDFTAIYHDGLVLRSEVERAIRMVLEACQQTLIQQGLYAIDGILPYDYLHRRGQDAIVLLRRDLIPLD